MSAPRPGDTVAYLDPLGRERLARVRSVMADGKSVWCKPVIFDGRLRLGAEIAVPAADVLRVGAA